MFVVASLVMVVILNILDTNSTPLHQFQSAKSHNLFERMGEEVSALATVIERQEMKLGVGKSSGQESQYHPQACQGS
ncbi:unnamed protein product [Dovyalis caffra]|uniref:Uncharacterized protein n=1 Tax=Dovyalis caffra TaxID=77055 RepID=A0AAV1QUA0_9ROSI|nr:unnamed protein product [Dovyalis caffra]